MNDVRVVQERDSVAAPTAVKVAVVTVVVAVLAVVGQSLLFGRGDATMSGPPSELRRRSNTAPREIGVVQQSMLNAGHDARAQVRAEQAALEHYGWVDRAHGVARIPIDRAMDLYVQRAQDAGALR